MSAAVSIVITSPGDKQLARCPWPDAGFEQSDPFETEPVYLVVPKNETDEAIARLVMRFGVAREQLCVKRDERWNDADSPNIALAAMCGAVA